MIPTDLISVAIERLGAHGVSLEPAHDAHYGPGADAWLGWDVFRELVSLPTYDLFDRDGETVVVDPALDSDLLLFNSGRYGRHFDPRAAVEGHDPDVDDLVTLIFLRDLTARDANDEPYGSIRLRLVVVLEPDALLRELGDTQIAGVGGPPWTDEQWRRRDEPPRRFEAATEWVAAVDRSLAFRAARDHGRVRRFFLAQNDEH